MITFTRSACGRISTVAVLLLLCAPADAQELPGLPGGPRDEGAQVQDATSPAAVESRGAEVASELRALEEALREVNRADFEHLRALQDKLRKLAELLDDHAALLSRPPAAEEAPQLPPSEAPSALALNGLYELHFTMAAQSEQRDALRREARQALEAAKARLERAEKERRKARDVLAEAAPGDKAGAAKMLELRELDSRVAQEEVYLRRAETRALQEVADAEARVELEGRIEEMRDALLKGGEGSAPGASPVIEREASLARRREAAERRLASVELALEAAQNRYLRRAEPSAELLAEVEALTGLRDLLRREVALTHAELARQEERRQIWSYWDSLVRGQAPRGDLDAWAASAEEQIAALRDVELEVGARLPELGRNLDGVRRQLAKVPVGSNLHRTLTEHVETLARLYDEQQAEGAAAAANVRVAERVLAEIRDQTKLVDWQEYVAQAVQTARDLWNYEIATVDDASITIGSVVLAILLFTIGLWAARRGSSFVAQTTRRRFKLDVGAAHAIQTLGFYTLLVAFTLLALRAIHFPLTAFTVLGGALAIGIGFGSQNVMNNFISGLILMLERPVRAHDVVEVDGNHGTIEKIGARSTQIRSVDGRHIIVPNSFFLESNVVNWTLSDDLIRAKVSVGVIYGSPTRLVEQLIRRVIDDDDQILQVPKPVVIFEEFGDNALNFDVYFWVKARSPMEMRMVQSRVRFRIDDLFRQHELVIAFPQRDVHLDSAAPLEVRVVTDNGRATTGTTDDAT